MAIIRNRNSSMKNAYGVKARNDRQVQNSRVLIIVILAIAIFLTSFFLPIFNIKHINVTGNAVLSTDNIVLISGIEMGANIFSVNLKNCRERISSNPYVQSVKIERSLPNSLKVEMVERKPVGYILFMGSYILVDKEGYVLEVASSIEKVKVPLLSGMRFNKFKIGEKIEVDDKEKLSIVFDCVKEILRNDLVPNISEIDIDDSYNIRFIVNRNITVNIGEKSELNYKISFLKEILNEIDNEESGYIDLSSGKPVFKPSSD